ncbi:Protein of unknown function [Gryllus bimaculatus]|nr:Protein of unknown function [Gryllus bimaculatus]
MRCRKCEAGKSWRGRSAREEQGSGRVVREEGAGKCKTENEESTRSKKGGNGVAGNVELKRRSGEPGARMGKREANDGRGGGRERRRAECGGGARDADREREEEMASRRLKARVSPPRRRGAPAAFVTTLPEYDFRPRELMNASAHTLHPLSLTVRKPAMVPPTLKRPPGAASGLEPGGGREGGAAASGDGGQSSLAENENLREVEARKNVSQRSIIITPRKQQEYLQKPTKNDNGSDNSSNNYNNNKYNKYKVTRELFREENINDRKKRDLNKSNKDYINTTQSIIIIGNG